MTLQLQTAFGDPKQILLELAGQHLLSELLPMAVDRLAERSSIALVRIWLVLPPKADECQGCHFRSECPDQSLCLHLVASAANSLTDSDRTWNEAESAFRRFPIGVRKVGRIASSGQPFEVESIERDAAWVADPAWIASEQITSFAGQPLIHRDKTLGVLGIFSRNRLDSSCREWLRMIANHLAVGIANARALEEIDALRHQLEQDNEYLRDEVQGNSNLGELIGSSPSLQAVGRQIELVAPTEANVLILGESGTGKELVAREIHRQSRRANRPLIKVNCAAIPRELYESEFFGHTKGSFTGAIRDRVGRFELANAGTLFLDEIGEIPLDLQAKLLRVLQEGELERIGEERTRRVDVRVVAATNRNLRAESDAGRFRADLYYRLSVFPIELPTLRNRTEDIPLLAEHFLKRFARQLGRPQPKLTLANVQQLQSYSWPGNIRELQHVLERAMIFAADGKLRFELGNQVTDPKAAKRTSASADPILTDAQLREFEADNIRRAMQLTNGKIYGGDGAAALLAMKPTTLASRIRALDIR